MYEPDDSLLNLTSMKEILSILQLSPRKKKKRIVSLDSFRGHITLIPNPEKTSQGRKLDQHLRNTRKTSHKILSKPNPIM